MLSARATAYTITGFTPCRGFGPYDVARFGFGRQEDVKITGNIRAPSVDLRPQPRESSGAKPVG